MSDDTEAFVSGMMIGAITIFFFGFIVFICSDAAIPVTNGDIEKVNALCKHALPFKDIRAVSPNSNSSRIVYFTCGDELKGEITNADL